MRKGKILRTLLCFALIANLLTPQIVFAADGAYAISRFETATLIGEDGLKDADSFALADWKWTPDTKGRAQGMYFVTDLATTDKNGSGTALLSDTTMKDPRLIFCDENTTEAVGYMHNSIKFDSCSYQLRVGVTDKYTQKGTRYIWKDVDEDGTLGVTWKCDELFSNYEKESDKQRGYHKKGVTKTVKDIGKCTMTKQGSSDDKRYTHLLHHGALANGCFFFDDNDFIVIGVNTNFKDGHSTVADRNTFSGYYLFISPQYICLDVLNGADTIRRTTRTCGRLTTYWFNGSAFVSSKPDSDVLATAADKFLGKSDTDAYSDDDGDSGKTWSHGIFRKVGLTSSTAQNGKRTITIKGGSTNYSVSNVTDVGCGSVYFGAISQPCASFTDMQFGGTLQPSYVIYQNHNRTSNLKTEPMSAATVANRLEDWNYTWSPIDDSAHAGTKLGYKFLHYYKDPAGTNYIPGNVYRQSQAGNISLAGVFEPISYNIREVGVRPTEATAMIANDQAASDGLLYGRTYRCTYDSPVTLQPTNYRVQGWHPSTNWRICDATGTVVTAQDLQQKVMNLTATESDVPVFITHGWEPNKYKVRYNSNKPSYVEGVAQTKEVIYTYDKKHELEPYNTFSYEGAAFEGWALTANGQAKYTTPSVKEKYNLSIANDTTNVTAELYAKWRPTTYYVRWNKNNSSASGPNSIKTGNYIYGNEYTTEAAPKYVVNAAGEATYVNEEEGFTWKRQGYYIAYWSTDKNGAGKRYYFDSEHPVGTDNIEKTFRNLTSRDGGTVDLYAIWKPIKYTVILHSNDSTGDNEIVDPETTVDYDALYDSPLTLPSISALCWKRNNYENVPSSFMGWNIGANKDTSLPLGARQWVDYGHGNNTDITRTAELNDYVPIWKDAQAIINCDTTPLCIKRNGEYHLYTVWNDVPIVSCRDYELPYNEDTNVVDGTIQSLVAESSTTALSKTKLEEFLLTNCSSAYDREDGIYAIGDHRFINYFLRDDLATIDHPTTFEIKYSAKDKQGQITTKSARLYGGVKFDILVGTH